MPWDKKNKRRRKTIPSYSLRSEPKKFDFKNIIISNGVLRAVLFDIFTIRRRASFASVREPHPLARARSRNWGVFRENRTARNVKLWR